MCQIKGFMAGFVAASGLAAVVLGLGFAPQSGTGAPKSGSAAPPAAAPPASTPPAGPASDNERMKQLQDALKGADAQAAAQAIMEKFAAPGDAHKQLARKVGSWMSVNRMWMDPSAPPMESVGNSTMRMVLGGRYLLEEVRSTFMGQPFEAIGLTGFHNGTGKYEFAWMDTVGTAISTGVGAMSPDGKTYTWQSDMYDPAQSKSVKTRAVETWKDADHFTTEMFAAGPDGKEMKVMELVYTRTK